MDIITAETKLRAFSQLYFKESVGRKEWFEKLGEFQKYSLGLSTNQPSGWNIELDNLFSYLVVYTSYLKINIDETSTF